MAQSAITVRLQSADILAVMYGNACVLVQNAL